MDHPCGLPKQKRDHKKKPEQLFSGNIQVHTVGKNKNYQG